MTAVNGSTNVSMSLIGTFRDIQNEAKGTSVGCAVLDAPSAGHHSQELVGADPLVGQKIQNRALIFTERRELTGDDFTVADRVAAKFGLESVDEFVRLMMEGFCGRADVAGLELHQRLDYTKFKYIAAALLSSDAIRSVLSGAGTTGFAIGKEDLLQTALAVCALVSEGRLAIEDVPVYVSRKVCDARSVDDVAGMTQALLNQMRDSAENGGVQMTIGAIAEKLEERMDQLRSGPERTGLRKLLDVLNDQMENCRAARSGMLPADVILQRGVKGVFWKEQVEFENAQDYLKQQSDKLHDFLKSGPRPDFKVIAATDRTAAEAVLAALKDYPGGIDLLFPDEDEYAELTAALEECADCSENTSLSLEEAYQKDVIDVAKVVCRQMKFAIRAEDENQVRLAQENALRQLGYMPGTVPPRGAVFAMGFDARLGVRLGFSWGNVKVGAAVGYNMIAKIDESGKVRLLGIVRVGLDVKASADLLLGCKAFGWISGGVAFGSSAVYDSTVEMLEDSPSLVADALMRINGGIKGLFYSKGKTDELACKVDNGGYVAALKRYGIFGDFDDYSTRPLNRRVTGTEAVRTIDLGAQAGLTGDGPLASKIVADTRAEIKGESVQTTRTDYRPVTDIDLDLSSLRKTNNKIGELAIALETGTKIQKGGLDDKKIEIDPREQVLKRMKALEDELDDFESAVRYEDWQRDKGRYGKGSTSGFMKPKLSSSEHMKRRGIAPATDAKKTDACRAEFLRVLADELRFCQALVKLAKAKPEDSNDRKAYDLFQAKAKLQGGNLRKRILSPRFEFKTGKLDKTPLALKETLYAGKKHEATTSHRFHAEAFYQCGYGFGGVLPQVGPLADTFQNINPGIHLGLDVEKPSADSKTGVPHEDATTVDLTIGFSNFPGNAMLTSALKSFLLKAGFGKAVVAEIVPSLLDSMVLANSHMQLINGLKKAFGGDVDPARGAGSTLDFGVVKISMDMMSDSGLAFRFRLQSNAKGKLRYGRCDLLSRNNTYKGVELDVAPGFIGGYVGVGFNMSCEKTFQRTLLAHSLTPFLSEFAAYDVRRRGVDDPGWNLFLKQNDEALVRLAEKLRQKDANDVRDDFNAYVAMAAEVDVRNGSAEFGKRLGDSLRLILQATTPEERQTAFSTFGKVVGDLSEQYKKLGRQTSQSDTDETDKVIANMASLGNRELVVDEDGFWQLTKADGT